MIHTYCEGCLIEAFRTCVQLGIVKGFKSVAKHADRYLLEVSRYLHLNPVRTKELALAHDEEKTAYLRKYRWSSYPDYISAASPHPFLSLSDVLGHFRNKTAYREFVEEGMTLLEGPLEKGKGHGIVGDAVFIKNVLKQEAIKPAREQPGARIAMSRVEPERMLRGVITHFKAIPEHVLKSRYRGPQRSMAMELLYRHGGMSQREIGEMMGVDYSTVSVARKRLRDMRAKDRQLQTHFTTLETMLTQ
jgi:putative transposase